MTRYLLTIHTRTPLHVGSGASVEISDQPIMRERITNFPIIPGTGLKGVLRDRARQHFAADPANSDGALVRLLFGEDLDPLDEESAKKQGKNPVYAHAGCLQFMEAKLIAFPVRSLAGCFAWLTCPTALRRFQRDTGKTFGFPKPQVDTVVVTSNSELPADVAKEIVVLEEHALKVVAADIENKDEAGNVAKANPADKVAAAIKPLCADSLWSDFLPTRLAILHDDNFQHFVSTCTEVITRIAIDPRTRVVDGGRLFNQENVPCESVFYTVLTVLPEARNGKTQLPAGFTAPEDYLGKLLPTDTPAVLQFGGDETTGHGFCAVRQEKL